MGIQGLISLVKPASQQVHLSDLKGQTVAIDSYCWIHKGAFGCAEKIVKGEDTDSYVQYCFKFIDMLRSFRITPIMVFDGQNLPAKLITEEKRREIRAAAKKKAMECYRLNKAGEARMNCIKAIDVTPEMALKLIKACRKQNIDCIVAPYEADAQLAYLNQKGIVDFIITEDSDLLVFGCKKVLYKLDMMGNGLLVEGDKLFLSMNEKPDTFTIDKFRHMCILSGCDYLESLSGVGLKKAMKFVKSNSQLDIYDALPKLPSSLNLKNLTVSKEYRDNFMIADATFRHQLVFDPLERQLKALSDPEEAGTNPELCCNAGKMMERDTAYQLAIGNLSPDDLSKMDNWCPDRDISPYAFKKSIWSKSYVIPEKRKPEPQPNPVKLLAPSTRGTNVMCDVKLVASITEDEVAIEEKIKRDMERMYFDNVEPAPKKICLDRNSEEKELSSSQKENEVMSPILQKRRVFVKSRFFCTEKIESPKVDIKESVKKDSPLLESQVNNNDNSNNCDMIKELEKYSVETVEEKKEGSNIEKIEESDTTEYQKCNVIDLSDKGASLQTTILTDETIRTVEKTKTSPILKSSNCRRPGLTRKTSSSKLTVSKNQLRISAFFKKT